MYSKVNKEDLMRAGAKAFAEGSPVTDNPYKYTSHRRDGLMKEGYWQAGWMRAEREHANTA